MPPEKTTKTEPAAGSDTAVAVAHRDLVALITAAHAAADQLDGELAKDLREAASKIHL